MVFSFVTLYWFVESLSWGLSHCAFGILSESPEKGDGHRCYFTIFKPMEQKFIYFLNLKI
jgi:hypothetical protein